MKIVLISVGAPKTPGLSAAISDYESRISHYFRFETVDVRPQRITPNMEPKMIVKKESEALLAKVPSELELVALDERGVPWSSEELAAYFNKLAVQGKPGAAFLVGGPLGLSDELRCEARRVLSLSSFTLPHEMARLVLVEQIYRAGTIVRGEPYHKGG